MLKFLICSALFYLRFLWWPLLVVILEFSDISYLLQKLAHIHNSQHNQNFFDHFQTYTAIYYGHFELSGKEKSKFEFEEKKFSLLLKVAFSRQKRLQTSLFSNKLNFFPQIQIFTPDNSE